MDNPKIINLIEKQKDTLFEKIKGTSISGLYKKEYENIKAGRVFVLDNKEREMLKELRQLSKVISLDSSLENKLKEYKSFDDNTLIVHFQQEFERIINEIMSSGRQEEIQALFIEYDFYYHFSGGITCYGKQAYPEIEEPRYISGEYDHSKQVLFLNNGINFQPAWIDCQEFGNLDYLDINDELEKLCQLHSIVLLHKALDNLNLSGKLDSLQNQPFSFFINEHDCEVMMLYKLK